MNAPLGQLLDSRGDLDLAGAGVDWVETIRSENARRFAELGLPSPRDEDWKYTNIKPITKKAFSPARAADGVSSRDLAAFDVPQLEAHRVVLVDGFYAPALSGDSEPADGVLICSLASAIERHPELVRPYLGRLTGDAEHGFRALNSAFLQDGVFIHLADGRRFDRPIEICCVQRNEQPEVVSQPRNLVVAEPDAAVTVVERYFSLREETALTNAITEVFAAENAHVTHYRLQQESARSYHVGSWLIEQQGGSHVETNNVALGGAIARTDIRARLQGSGAHCGLNGVYVLGGRQHIDNHTVIHHRVADTTSDEYYKGVLDGRTRAVFHGRIIVHPDAQRTDARQQNKNLLLSRDAEVDTKPQLEIYADDVACSHGATVGQLNEEELYYLRTRGIDQQTARSLLTFAFANDVIDRFGLAALRDHVEHELTSKMFSADNLEEVL